MTELGAGFYRFENTERPGVPPAYGQVTESRKVVLVYPTGQVYRNDAAILLLNDDLLPVCSVEEVDREETPFGEGEDEVSPRPPEGPDPHAL